MKTLNVERLPVEEIERRLHELIDNRQVAGHAGELWQLEAHALVADLKRRRLKGSAT